MIPVAYTEKGSGLHDAVRQAGFRLWNENGLWFASDPAVQAILTAYNPLPDLKTNAAGTGKLDVLRAEAQSRIDLSLLLDAGTGPLAGAELLALLAAVISHYRAIKAAIQAAPDAAALHAINLNAGWP